MTDINTRGKLPFTIVSSSVNTGYATQLTSSVGYNIDIVNHHKDEYGGIENSPLQGPFTAQHVGGNQNRHVKLNEGSDDSDSRPEAYIISASAGSVKVYGPDVNGIHKPRSLLTRDTTAKSPVNIKNIQTSGNIAGNFEHNYQVVQTSGRNINQSLIQNNLTASGVLTSKFVTIPAYYSSSLKAYITSSGDGNPAGDAFGSVINISGDSNTLLASSPNSDIPSSSAGAISVFRKNINSEWVQEAFLTSSGDGNPTSDNLGRAIAINYDGTIIAASYNGDTPVVSAGAIAVYRSSSLGWTQEATLLSGIAANIGFGGRLDINENGDVIAVGATTHNVPSTSAGGVFIYNSSSVGGWALQQILTSSTGILARQLGADVKINFDGTKIAAGGRFQNCVIMFESGSFGWQETAYITGSSSDLQFMGLQISLNKAFNTMIAGAYISAINGNFDGQGSAVIFASSSIDGWKEEKILLPPEPGTDFNFGSSVAIDQQGNSIFVASQGYINSVSQTTGAVYIYDNLYGEWLNKSTITSDTNFFANGLVSSIKVSENGSKFYINCVSSSVVEFDRFFIEQNIPYTLPEQPNNKTVFVQRFNAPGGKEVSSRGALDREGEECAPNNSLITRNIGVRQPYYNKLTQHAAQFNSGSTYKLLPDTGSVNAVTIHGINRNTLQKVFITGTSYFTGSKHDNFWVQHAIPRTDLRYKWIADSVSSSQQPIEYQSYNLPYSISNSYNSNGAFTDLEFQQKGPFGDHLGISGAIDKDEMHVSTYTNTMYRDRKYLFFTSSNDCYVDASSISSEISERDFSISFWVNFPNSASNGEKTLLVYSGSSTQNELVMNVSSSLCGLTISGSQLTTEYQLSSSLLDSSWHLVTLTSDVTTTRRRITTFVGDVIQTTTYPTVTKVYLDGGLVSKATQQNKIFNLSRITLSVGRGSELQGGRLDEVYFWNRALTEQEIVEIYRTTKTDYNKQPKKYVQHKLDNSNIPVPTHVYSSDVEKNTLLDLAGSRNLPLVNFTSSVNIRPQDTGIISYSTYFNGPYQGASWKSIRNAEHPVTRKLTTENTNIISTLIEPNNSGYTGSISQLVVTGMGVVERIVVNSRKNGTILNVKESPVYTNNKPLKHKFILKDSQNINAGFELTHTYANNLQYFASNQLNLTLGLDKKERQIYDSLLEYYNGSVEENENPIDKLVGYTYSETIFPKPGQALLKDVRQRTDYITDQPGYSVDGYDRQLGTQRSFWRDSQEDRMRTRRTYITSLGDQVESVYDLPFQTPSIAALEYISEGNSLEYIKFATFPTMESYIDLSYKKSAELNNQMIFIYSFFDLGIGGSYTNIIQPVNQLTELYFFKNISTTTRDDYNVILSSGLYPLQKTSDPSSLRLSPNLIYQHACIIFTSAELDSSTVYNNMTHDLGLNRFTEKISGKNPWYNSYEDYYVDIKTLSNDNLISYSKIPEFKISDQISQFVTEYSGDATKITLQEYLNDLRFNYKTNIDRDNNEFCEEDTIKIVVDGVKKLLPYNGFYPQDRSLQLVNYLKQSYLDTNAIGGGIFLSSSLSPGELILREESDKLVQYMKESAFLEPLYSPGIFYNLIKSGIAVDWGIYTGSIPAGSLLIPLLEKPQFKITFESLLNLQNIPLSSSLETKDNRMMKHKELNQQFNASEYGVGTDTTFQGFFEKLSEGSPVYTLSINNFLAETINFFLKDSTLNTFISKPDSDFLSFDSNKTYYMDVVLRKNNIVMCEAHSSSLADNFGRMSGRYFGPSFWTGSVADAERIENSIILAETLRDPGYCAYTPPYFYGDSIARMSFKPTISGKYTLGEIFQEMETEFINTGFLDDSTYTSGSLYSSFVMPLNSSIKLDGRIEERQQSVQLETLSRNFSNLVTNNLTNLAGTATNTTDIYRWVISPKMETPIIDFSNQEFVTSTTILTQSNVDIELSNNSPSLGGYVHTPPTASGFGRGMWSGYGEIPEGDKGIFLELKESYPRQLSQVYNSITQLFETTTNTASLLQACGFQQNNSELSKKIGEIADSRDISEALIIIPYLTGKSNGKTISFGGEFSTLIVNDTVQVEGHSFIKINQQIFNHQKTNLFANKPAVSLQDFSLGVGNIQETSISRMTALMSKYVLPPNFDFLINESISPFVMYIAEFTSNLDKQDLADVWQGVMPKIAMRAEREKQIISHKNTQFDFFHGQGLPKDVKFMIFKAKKRAEINYYKMTSDASDDGLFPSIQTGRPPSPYSFNWPYDYCSLVETATVNVEIEYMNNSGSNTQ